MDVNPITGASSSPGASETRRRDRLLAMLDHAWLLMRSEPFEAELLLDHVDRLCGELNDPEIALQVLAWQCELHFLKGELPACVDTALRAEHLRSLAGWRRFGAILQTNSARALALMGRYSDALSLFQRQYQDALRDDDPVSEASSLNNMGLVCCSTGDLLTAHRLFDAALQLYRRLGDGEGECLALNNLACHSHDDDLPTALGRARQALELAVELRLPSARCMVLDTLGGLYLRMGELDEAAQHLEAALEDHSPVAEQQVRVPILLHLARLDVRRGRVEAALARLDEADPLIERHGLEPQRAEAALLRSEMLEMLLRPGEALQELKRHLAMKEQVLGAQERQRVKDLQLLHETTARRRESEALRRRARELEALADVGREITSSLDTDTVLDRICRRARELFNGCDSAIYLLQPGSGFLRARCALGPHTECVRDVEIPLDGSLAGAVCQTGEVTRVNRPLADKRVLLLAPPRDDEDPNLFCILAAGLRNGDEALGALLVWRERQAGDFTQGEEELLAALAQGAAVAIHNAHYFAELDVAKRQADSALAQIRTLSGLLPICARCQSIRDDSGYWHDVADYIKDHTGAEFSHGLCPDCLRKLYPEMAGLLDPPTGDPVG